MRLRIQLSGFRPPQAQIVRCFWTANMIATRSARCFPVAASAYVSSAEISVRRCDPCANPRPVHWTGAMRTPGAQGRCRQDLAYERSFGDERSKSQLGINRRERCHRVPLLMTKRSARARRVRDVDVDEAADYSVTSGIVAETAPACRLWPRIRHERA